MQHPQRAARRGPRARPATDCERAVGEPHGDRVDGEVPPREVLAQRGAELDVGQRTRALVALAAGGGDVDRRPPRTVAVPKRSWTHRPPSPSRRAPRAAASPSTTRSRSRGRAAEQQRRGRRRRRPRRPGRPPARRTGAPRRAGRAAGRAGRRCSHGYHPQPMSVAGQSPVPAADRDLARARRRAARRRRREASTSRSRAATSPTRMSSSAPSRRRPPPRTPAKKRDGTTSSGRSTATPRTAATTCAAPSTLRPPFNRIWSLERRTRCSSSRP